MSTAEYAVDHLDALTERNGQSAANYWAQETRLRAQADRARAREEERRERLG